MYMWIEGNFKVGSRPFSGWFRKVKARYPEVFPHELNARNFAKVIRRIELLTGKQAISVNEFIGHFVLVYHETKGTFAPVTECGPVPEDADDFRNDAWFFTQVPGKKRSYNHLPQNMPAGDLLRDWGVISSDKDVDVWNSTTDYPFSQPEIVRRRARDCDFYKFRGRGLHLISFRTGYTQYVDPLLSKVTTGHMTNSGLDKAFQTPLVYCGAFRNFITDPFWAGKAIPGLISGDFTQYPQYFGGKTAVDYHKQFLKRCQTLRLALRGAGVE